MTLEVYLDNALQTTETVNSAALITGTLTHQWVYSFGGVVLESITEHPIDAVTVTDPASYSVIWTVKEWPGDAPTCTRGRYPCHYSHNSKDFKCEVWRRGASGPEVIDRGNVEYEYTNSATRYSHMLTSTIKVYFTSDPKTHLPFRDSNNGNTLVRSATGGLVRDD